MDILKTIGGMYLSWPINGMARLESAIDVVLPLIIGPTNAPNCWNSLSSA